MPTVNTTHPESYLEIIAGSSDGIVRAKVLESEKVEETTMSKKRLQDLPLRIHRNENQFVIVAPLAGVEPEDITIALDGKHLTIHAKKRGPRQDHLDLIRAEWSIGPYHRRIELPETVDGSLANATYGNGVLVLTVPKTGATSKSRPTEFTLEAVQPTRGERVGHVGHNIRPTTTREHWARLAEIPKRRVA